MVNNLIAFLNMFLSYVLLLAIIVVIAGIGMVVGTKLRKKKDLESKKEEMKV
ncbi:MAG: hypothetical protein ACRC7V_06965 [Lachnospiraceae bacterium]